jgi:hypothetical protein
MANQLTAYGKRVEYEVAKQSLESQGIIVTDDNLSQSYLRFESTLAQNRSSYKFPVLVTQQNAGTTTPNTVKQLNQQDAFYCTEIGYFIKVVQKQGSTNRDILEYVPYTYPSQGMSEDGTVFAAYGYKLWSGEIGLTVNGDVIIPGMDLQRFLYIPEGQKDVWNGPFPMSTFYRGQDQYDGSSDAFYPLAPEIVLLGNDKIDLSVTFPDTINNAIGADATVNMVIMVRGLLAQNVTKVSSNT